MNGLKTNWLSSLLSLAALCASAHTPLPGQIARFQAGLMRGQAPFQMKGDAFAGESKLATQLIWNGTGRYQITVSNIPRSLYADETFSSTWTLIRNGKSCILKTDAFVVTCPEPTFWALFEFSSTPDAVATALKNSEFYSTEDAQWQETDGKALMATKEIGNKRVRLNVGQNGKTPIAVLEIPGPSTNTDSAGESYPLLQFDQTFLAPVLARWKQDNVVYTIKAASNLDVGRTRPRFTHVISSRVEVSEGTTAMATFSRADATELPAPFKILSPNAITDDEALRNSLSSQGKNFLTALLLTH